MTVGLEFDTASTCHKAYRLSASTGISRASRESAISDEFDVRFYLA
jgi:hypothetical protein